MKILVVGGGGREHAIIHTLAKSKYKPELHSAPGNGGISLLAECHDVKTTDITGMVRLAEKIEADYVFVAPDDPLVLGMVDALEAAGFKTFGPRKNAAIIEGSKVFSKNLMKKYGIPTADYERFTDAKQAVFYIKEKNIYPAVIKCDGLALGKGVIIAQNLNEAEEAVNSMLGGKFGDSGKEIIVEEYLTGPEVSVLVFTDGKTAVPMLASTDHKRASDGDNGLNTGGMGTIAPSPYYTEEHKKECLEKIITTTVEAMKSEGRPFKGCLYFGLMLTANGIKVIEYNCRFGDPEAQVILPLLKTDLVEIIKAVDEEKLDEINIEWSDEYAACVVAASGGYPEKYETGLEISGLENTEHKDGVIVFHAGTKRENSKFLTAGGRVLGVTALGKTLEDAINLSYKSIRAIDFTGAFYRTDIGKKALDK